MTASAAGVVSLAVGDVRQDEVSAGYGYGRHIKVAHHSGLNTMYAHLDAVFVRKGDRVDPGDRLGTMGMTGRAGLRHLHFCLNEGHSDEAGGFRTVPIERLQCSMLRERELVELKTTGASVRANYAEFWQGDILGAGPPSQGLQASVAALKRYTNARSRLARLASTRHSLDPARVEAELATLDPKYREHPLAYLIRGSLRSTTDDLERALELNRKPQWHEPWLPARAHLELGQIHADLGNDCEVREHLQRAKELSTSKAVAKQIAAATKRITMDAKCP